jgi:hypothetical protein
MGKTIFKLLYGFEPEKLRRDFWKNTYKKYKQKYGIDAQCRLSIKMKSLIFKMLNPISKERHCSFQQILDDLRGVKMHAYRKELKEVIKMRDRNARNFELLLKKINEERKEEIG